MAKRHLLSSIARGSFFDIPSDMASLERYYVLAMDDLDLISSRRGAENRLGLAIHIALLRHPGQGWRDNDQIPPEVIHWLSDQIHVSTLRWIFTGTAKAPGRRIACLPLSILASGHF